jgi:hypothetical protein
MLSFDAQVLLHHGGVGRVIFRVIHIESKPRSVAADHDDFSAAGQWSGCAITCHCLVPSCSKRLSSCWRSATIELSVAVCEDFA